MGQEHGHGDKAQPTVAKTGKIKAVDVKTLIDALENHNPAPSVVDPVGPNAPNFGTLLFDKKYNWSEYRRVNKAIQSLVNHSEEAWPELLRHLDDKRYCMTYHNDVGFNNSIGDMCRLIAKGCLVEAYYRHSFLLFGMVPNPEEANAAIHYPDMVRSARDLRAWCEKRKEKKLYELQIEMCEWAVSRAGRLKGVSDKERGPFVNAVRAEIVELRQSKKAVPFQGFGRNENFEVYDAELATRIRKQLTESGPSSGDTIHKGTSSGDTNSSSGNSSSGDIIHNY